MSESQDKLITVINLIAMPTTAADAFVEAWPTNSAPIRDTPGFRDTRLLRHRDHHRPAVSKQAAGDRLRDRSL